MATASARSGNTASTSAPAIGKPAAVRFLAQAATGATPEDIQEVQRLGYAGWLEAQFAKPRGQTRWDWLLANNCDAPEYQGTLHGFDAAMWSKLISAPDTLRQRVALALSEVLVVGVDGLKGAWKSFAGAYYYDILEKHAFGNFRSLLEDVTLSPAMGVWLTYRGNAKANPDTGSLPDENFAREIMQLFTIGLLELNPDGSLRLEEGRPVETYDQSDIMGLARVWTGWNWDLGGTSFDVAVTRPDYQGRPMIQQPRRHETGEKVFLDTVIPAGTDGHTSMAIALDTLFNHANVGPFLAKQLIQRLVTSNPSPAYIARVAAAFNGASAGQRGDLKAVVRAILLDEEARGSAASTTFGKLREPMLRLTQWARAYGATSAEVPWLIGNTSDPATKLGQSPLRSPSVFNFFRPGYVPPGGALGAAGLLAPEFQITSETSVVGYVNFMQRVIASGHGNYQALQALAGNGAALVAEIGSTLAGDRISVAHQAVMASAIDAMPAQNPGALLRRIQAALLLVMASPEYIVQH